MQQPNDVMPDRMGGIYFTDPARRPAPDVAPKEPGNVYYIRPGGDVVLFEEEIARPNGITLSIDEKTLAERGDRRYTLQPLNRYTGLRCWQKGPREGK